MPQKIIISDADHDYDTDHLNSAIKGANLGLWDWDLQTGEAVHNETWGRLIGYSPEEVQSDPRLWERNIHADDQPLVSKNIAELLSGESDFYETEHRLRCKNGEWRWILSRAKVIKRNSAGKPLRVAGSHQDITDRKNIEQQLLQERTLLRALIDSLPDHIFAKDRDGRFIVKNKASATFLGTTPDQAIGNTDFDFYPAEEARHYRETELQVMHSQQPLIDETLTRKNPLTGESLVLSVNKIPLCDDQGEVIGIVGAGRDVTAKLELEKQLRAQQQRFRDFATLGADILWETDADHRYTFVSDDFESVTGYSPKSRLGRRRGAFVSNLYDDADIQRGWRRHLADLNKHIEFYNFEFPALTNNGQTVYVRTSGLPRFDSDGRFIGYRGIDINITQAKQLSEQLVFQAEHDALTNLPNRRQFERRLCEVHADRGYSGPSWVLGYLDLDQFKIVNDTAGHAAGDELLKQVATLLSSQLRHSDVLARLGGDEFGLLLYDVNIDQAHDIAEQIVSTLSTFRFNWQQRHFEISVSIGLVAIAADTDLEQLTACADIACYTAKDLGRNRVHVYCASDQHSSRRRNEIRLIADLREAIKQNRLCLYQQAIADLNTPELTFRYREILVRMRDKHKQGVIIGPNEFVPAAERYGLMPLIDHWVIRNALSALATYGSEESRFAINLSGASLSRSNTFDYIKQLFTEFAIAPQRVCFEITETALISNQEQATILLRQLREIGSCVALDDFGSGLSSFAYLKRFTVDYLKIDGSFVCGIVDNDTDRAMVEVINQMGHTLGIKTVAEFVENDAILDCLRNIGVDYAQGYTIARPEPLSTHTLPTACHATAL